MSKSHQPVRIGSVSRQRFTTIWRTSTGYCRPWRNAQTPMNPNLLLLIALSLSAFSAQAPQMQETGPAIEPAISADGRWLAFASDRGGSSFLHLWVRPSSGGDARQLTAGLHDDDEPVFSPDGRMLA